MNREDCQRWMRRQVQEGAKRFSLSTVSSELRKGSEELMACRVRSHPDDRWFKATAKAVEEAVRRDMETLESPTQAYALIACDKDGELMDRFPFREMDPDAGEAQPEPTSSALMSQLMAHNRDLARVMSDMVKSTTSFHERTLSQLTESHAKMLDDRLSTVELIENLRSQQFERMLALKQSESEDEARSQVIAKLMALAPVALAKLTGHVLPGTGSESDQLVQSLIESLKPDQLDKLTAVLSPEQQMVVLTLIDTFKKREEAQEQAKAKAAEAKPDLHSVK